MAKGPTSHDHVTLIHLPRIVEEEEGYQCRKFKEIKADFFFLILAKPIYIQRISANPNHVKCRDPRFGSSQ